MVRFDYAQRTRFRLRKACHKGAFRLRSTHPCGTLCVHNARKACLMRRVAAGALSVVETRPPPLDAKVTILWPEKIRVNFSLLM